MDSQPVPVFVVACEPSCTFQLCLAFGNPRAAILVFLKSKTDIFETPTGTAVQNCFLENLVEDSNENGQSVTAPTHPTNSIGPATPSPPPSVTCHNIPPCHTTPAAPPKNLPKMQWPHAHRCRTRQSHHRHRHFACPRQLHRINRPQANPIGERNFTTALFFFPDDV